MAERKLTRRSKAVVDHLKDTTSINCACEWHEAEREKAGEPRLMSPGTSAPVIVPDVNFQQRPHQKPNA